MKFYRYFRSVATFGGSLIWELYGNALKNSVSKQVDIENKRKYKIIIHGPYLTPLLILTPGHSLIWPIRGCAAGQGMVFDFSVLNRVIISCKSLLKRVYILGSFYPKQGQGFKPSAAHLYPNTGPVSPSGL